MSNELSISLSMKKKTYDKYKDKIKKILGGKTHPEVLEQDTFHLQLRLYNLNEGKIFDENMPFVFHMADDESVDLSGDVEEFHKIRCILE